MMNSYLLLPIFLLFSYWLPAQNLIIDGHIVIQENNTTGAKIIISKNDVRIDEISPNKKGHFEIKLALDGDYKLAFTQPGYVSKIVNVNTEVPEEIIASNPNFPPVTLIMNLFPALEGIDISLFEQPIAILNYNYEVDDFVFDKEYSEKIKPRVDQVEQEIRHQLASRSAAAIEQERKFAAFVSKGQQAFDKKEWAAAIEAWTAALAMKAGEKGIEEKIEAARKEAELEKAQQEIERQNAYAYQLLISSADSLFRLKNYSEAIAKYTEAARIDTGKKYPTEKIEEINALMAELAHKKAEQEKQLAQLENEYLNAITSADREFEAQNYEKAIAGYQQALQLKASEKYPQERIVKAETAIKNLREQQAAEAERKRMEAEKLKELRVKYNKLIAEADAAFKNENYSLSKVRYTEADQLKLDESYPQKQITAIDNIIHSAKYQTKLAEYNKNKTLAEKNMQDKKYAAAKVYYQKALSLLVIDKDDILQKIAEIDRQIEAEHLAAIEKEYKAHIAKADKAMKDKAFAVAKFYYQKAVEIKIGDQYATEKLKEVEQNITSRKEKQVEL